MKDRFLSISPTDIERLPEWQQGLARVLYLIGSSAPPETFTQIVEQLDPIALTDLSKSLSDLPPLE